MVAGARVADADFFFFFKRLLNWEPENAALSQRASRMAETLQLLSSQHVCASFPARHLKAASRGEEVGATHPPQGGIRLPGGQGSEGEPGLSSASASGENNPLTLSR